jgi:hypothetical protein
MSWGSPTNVLLTINKISIKDVFNKQELVSFVNELSNYEFDIRSKIKNPVFFEELNYYLSFTEESNKFSSNFSIILEATQNDVILISPVQVLEFLLFAQFISKKLPNDTIDLFIGEKNYVILSLSLSDEKIIKLEVKKNRSLKNENNLVDIFDCTKEELLSFFNISIIDRISKKKQKKTFSKIKVGFKNDVSSTNLLNPSEVNTNKDIALNNSQNFIENYRIYENLEETSRFDLNLTYYVMKSIMLDFNIKTDILISLYVVRSLRFNNSEKLLSFINWLLPHLYDYENELGELYYYRAEYYQRSKKINDYILDIKKSIDLQKNKLSTYITSYNKYWADKIFIEALTNYTLFELTINDNTDVNNLDIKSMYSKLSEKICLRERFIYECKSEILKEVLKRIKELQTKNEIIQQLNEVKTIDWLFSGSDRLQFPVVGINNTLYKDIDLKKLSIKICPDSQLFFLKDNENEYIKFASKRPILYEGLPLKMKLKMEILISNISLTHDIEIFSSWIPKQIFDLKENVVKLCQENGKIYKFLPEIYMKDLDVILASIKQNHLVIDDLKKELLEDQDFILKLINSNSRCLLRLNPSYLKDKKFVLAALRNSKKLEQWELKKIISNFCDDDEIKAVNPNL